MSLSLQLVSTLALYSLALAVQMSVSLQSTCHKRLIHLKSALLKGKNQCAKRVAHVRHLRSSASLICVDLRAALLWIASFQSACITSPVQISRTPGRSVVSLRSATHCTKKMTSSSLPRLVSCRSHQGRVALQRCVQLRYVYSTQPIQLRRRLVAGAG